jgi:hypothetical protein
MTIVNRSASKIRTLKFRRELIIPILVRDQNNYTVHCITYKYRAGELPTVQ